LEKRRNKLKAQRRATFLSGFFAILYYEFLWNLRKKKTIGLFLLIFAIATLELALPPILDYYQGVTLQPNPNVVFNFYDGISGIFLFLIALATTMNTISGEFETGSITPLLTKPVSKNTVFIGKLTASLITLLAIYAFLTAYVTVGGYFIEGTQNNLQLVPLGLVGLTLATMVWASVVILLGTLSEFASSGSRIVWSLDRHYDRGRALERAFRTDSHPILRARNGCYWKHHGMRGGSWIRRWNLVFHWD